MSSGSALGVSPQAGPIGRTSSIEKRTCNDSLLSVRDHFAPQAHPQRGGSPDTGLEQAKGDADCFGPIVETGLAVSRSGPAGEWQDATGAPAISKGGVWQDATGAPAIST